MAASSSSASAAWATGAALLGAATFLGISHIKTSQQLTKAKAAEAKAVADLKEAVDAKAAAVAAGAAEVKETKARAEVEVKAAREVAARASADARAARLDADKLRVGEVKGSGVRGGGPPAQIVSIASAFPPNTYAQSQYLQAFLRNHPGIKPADEDFTRRVWAGTGFDTCSSYLREDELFTKMSRTTYVKYIKKSLKDLAMRSATEAIANWGGDRSTITHIIFGTMTGSIHAPTLDREIALELKLPVPIKCLNVEGMGCLTGYRCLGLASDIARADPSHIVLVVVCDIRSALGNQLSPFKPGDAIDKSNVIVSSLFRDSGASAIVTSSAAASAAAVPKAVPVQPLYEIIEHRSALLPDTFDRVKYQELDDAVIHLYIAKELPGDIKKALPGQVKALLEPHGLTTEDCSFSVHTGGPKVLEYVAEGLQCSKARMAASWYTMKKWGNLSGSSNLVVLDQWRKLPAGYETEAKPYVVCMSFGPGVGMELVLLKVTSPAVPGYVAPRSA